MDEKKILPLPVKHLHLLPSLLFHQVVSNERVQQNKTKQTNKQTEGHTAKRLAK